MKSQKEEISRIEEWRRAYGITGREVGEKAEESKILNEKVDRGDYKFKFSKGIEEEMEDVEKITLPEKEEERRGERVIVPEKEEEERETASGLTTKRTLAENQEEE